ncbi:hypothetical protein [Desulfosediminicola ganghwensis]|uniref:hypothetical protein n=1 Tax=Desulfosediminicola ganghwensis TaxID=2569540 RepID=UPI001592D65F|nr:hypothetical protein [Desulfosediminicola ganghwensis]
MFIDPKEKVAGVSLLAIRDFICKSEEVHESELLDHFGKLTSEPEAVLKHLLDTKYLIKNTEKDCGADYLITQEGQKFCSATIPNLIHRSKAQKELQELIERVIEVNSNESYFYQVDLVAIFGDYISDKEEIEPIDVFIEGKLKDSVLKKYGRRGNAGRILAKKHKRKINSSKDAAAYPVLHAIHKLQNQSKSFQIVNSLREVAFGGPVRVRICDINDPAEEVNMEEPMLVVIYDIGDPSLHKAGIPYIPFRDREND